MFFRATVSRRLLFLAVTTGTALLLSLAAACGVDVTGTPSEPTEASADVRGEASLPPTQDVTTNDVVQVDAGNDADATTPSPCGPANLKGPTLVEIPDAGFCIDSTEVTAAQYADFLAATNGGKADAGVLDASVLDGGLPPFCKRDGFAPGGGESFDAGPPTFPVANVNWCDAFAYCQWAGKRLCSGPTTDGGMDGEWQSTCTHNGDQKLPNSDGDASTCNVGRTATAPPKSFAGCEGGFAGVFDMLGNVEEWVDCDDGGQCALYGANFSHAVAVSSCGTVGRFPPTLKSVGFGIRCCR